VSSEAPKRHEFVRNRLDVTLPVHSPLCHQELIADFYLLIALQGQRALFKDHVVFVLSDQLGQLITKPS